MGDEEYNREQFFHDQMDYMNVVSELSQTANEAWLNNLRERKMSVFLSIDIVG